MVIEPALEEAMKVTVIATGFDRSVPDRPRATLSLASTGSTGRNVVTLQPVAQPIRDEPEASAAEVPFYRKAMAHGRGEDPNGFGPNWSNVDDYDIPTVLR